MGANVKNYIKVIGKRNKLFQFYDDVRGIRNNHFDFNRVIVSMAGYIMEA
jgi:hypothetical protein